MKVYPRIKLKQHKDKSLYRFHPWVFSGAIAQKPYDLKEGDLVSVHDAEGKFLAIGHYQIGSIAVKIVSFQEIAITDTFWKIRIHQAINLRKAIGLWDHPKTNMFRLIHGKGDGFPGLIIDIYDRVAVLKCYSIGFYHMRDKLASWLIDASGGKVHAVYDKSATALPFKAALDPKDQYLIGFADKFVAKEHGLSYEIDVIDGQITIFL